MAKKTRAPAKRKAGGGSRVSTPKRKAKSAPVKSKKPAKPATRAKPVPTPRAKGTRVVSRPALRPVQGKPDTPDKRLVAGAERLADALERSSPLIPTVITKTAPTDVIWHYATRIDGEFSYKQLLDALDSFKHSGLINKNRLAFVRLEYKDADGTEDGYAPTAATTWQNVLATLKNDFDPSKERSLVNRYRRSKVTRFTIWWGPELR